LGACVAVCEECGATIVASTPAMLRAKMGFHRLFHGHKHIRPIVIAMLSIMILFIGFAAASPMILSNVLTGTVTVAAPQISIQGYTADGKPGGGQLLPSVIGLNVPYYPNVTISLQAGRIPNVYLVVNFTVNGLEPKLGDVKLLIRADPSFDWTDISSECSATGNTLYCRHSIGEIGSGATPYSATIYLSISFINETWIGRQFNYAVGLEA
jgi:hypothetical protein